MEITVIGLGEAGMIYARGLRERGYSVRGYDPYAVVDDERIRQIDSLEEALRGAELVITLVGARAAQSVVEEVLENLDGTPIIADFNTSGPELKAQLEKQAEARGVAFVDVAVLAPVPRKGASSPLMVSGSGTEGFVEAFKASGAPIEAVPGPAGQAAAHKLIRSIFMKGLSGVVIESMRAAKHVGADGWLMDQMIAELSGDAEYLITRLIDGAQAHAARRSHEVGDVAAFLGTIGQKSWMTEAVKQWFNELDRENNN